jgi:alkylation response protein AidB-like acyl-CoA dehydrogenase
MANMQSFNEVFFEDVRVPMRNRVGEENRGWYVGTTTLDFERSSIGSAIGVRKQLEGLIRQAKRDGSPASFANRKSLKHEFVDRFVEAEVAKMLSYRVISMQANGKIPNYESSMCKLFSSELSQKIALLSLHLYGMHGLIRNRSSVGYVGAVSSTIAGGTSEIQKGIIATRGLGLPRG